MEYLIKVENKLYLILVKNIHHPNMCLDTIIDASNILTENCPFLSRPHIIVV